MMGALKSKLQYSPIKDYKMLSTIKVQCSRNNQAFAACYHNKQCEGKTCNLNEAQRKMLKENVYHCLWEHYDKVRVYYALCL